MSAVAALLDLFPNKSDLARDIGLKSPTHIGTMKVRMQVNPFLWPAIVESARKRKVRGVSIRALHAAHQADAPMREALKASRAPSAGKAVINAEPARATA